MRKRFQNGSVNKSADRRYWIGQWREDGPDGKRHKRSRVLGKTSKMTKSEARDKMADIVKPINEQAARIAPKDITMKDFVENVFLPFYRRKWKRTTDKARTDSIMYYILGQFGSRQLSSLTRDEMQQFLDNRKHLAFSMVDHLRWDLKQILDLAVAEAVIARNPVYVSGTMLLFVPRECPKPNRPVMTLEQSKQAFEVLSLRERCIVKLGIIGGMRCSEIFGLRRGSVRDDRVGIVERVCKRDVDTPKTEKSVREAALSRGLQQDLELWLASSADTGPNGWLFPSEKLTTPLGAGQRYGATHPATAENGRAGMGGLPRSASNTFFIDEVKWRRSEGGRRSAGTHGRCESERLHDVLCGEPTGGSPGTRISFCESNRRLME